MDSQECAVWIEPGDIERKYAVKLRNLQNLMHILEVVGLVSEVM